MRNGLTAPDGIVDRRVARLRGARHLTLLIVLLAACTPNGDTGAQPSPVATSTAISAEASASPAPASSASATPAPTPQRVTQADWADGRTTTSDIQAHLVGAGLRVEQRSTAIQPLFGARSAIGLLVNGSKLSVFEFTTDESVESAFQLVRARRETVTWEATPYFVRLGRNLAVLTTSDSAAAARVLRALVNP